MTPIRRLGLLVPLAFYCQVAAANQFVLATTNVIVNRDRRNVSSKEKGNRRKGRWPLQSTHTLERNPAVESTTNPSPRKESRSTSIAPQSPPNTQLQLDILSKCAASSISCAASWFLAQRADLPVARASSICGFVACAFFSPPLAAACFSGALTGMSSYIKKWQESLFLATITGALYGLESSRTKILVGKGGRLGTIGVFASILYFAIRADERCFGLLADLVNRIGEVQLGVIISALTLLIAAQKSPPKYVRSKEGGLRLNLSINTLVSCASKLTIMALLGSRYFATKFDMDSAFQLLKTAFVMFICGLFVQFCPGNVLPMSIVGFVASFSSQVAPMSIGGLAGMTKLPGFGIPSLLESCFLSSMLLGIGGLDGIGGRLGIFTILGVTVAMNSWSKEAAIGAAA